jgi:hypothetical protein
MGGFSIALMQFHQLCGNNTRKPGCVMLLQDQGWRVILLIRYKNTRHLLGTIYTFLFFSFLV